LSAPGHPGFDRYARDYGEALAKGISLSGEGIDFFATGRLAILKAALERRGANPAKILDFGCGNGTAAPFVLSTFPGAEYAGVDVSEECLAVARKSHGSCFRHLGEYAPEGEYDLVFTNGVFHHIPGPEQPGALDYIARALKPGGYFALWENNPWNPGARLVMRRIPFDRDAAMLWPAAARRLLRGADLAVELASFAFIFPRPLRLLRPLERYVSRLPLGAQYLVLGRKPA